jgi:hypothetical protein
LRDVPSLLTPGEVGRATRRSRRSAKSMLRGAGVLEQHENGRWYVGRTRLWERLPDVYDDVCSYFAQLPSQAPKSDR